MNELFSSSSFNINNINISEEFDLSKKLFFFNNPKSIELIEEYE
ncbi:12682_t:CDS:2 [Rhizophagus irregularis]|nr:12682_t:CDS:2 [Rhizophagus irregularis]